MTPPTIKSLSDLLTCESSAREYRITQGMRNLPNVYDWKKLSATVIANHQTPISFDDINDITTEIGMPMPKNSSRLLTKWSEKKERDPIQRDMAFADPGIAKALKLDYKIVIVRGVYTKMFFFHNPKTAKNIILSIWPDTTPFFNLLEKSH